jgi:hypothetical protein
MSKRDAGEGVYCVRVSDPENAPVRLWPRFSLLVVLFITTCTYLYPIPFRFHVSTTLTWSEMYVPEHAARPWKSYTVNTFTGVGRM